MVEAAGMHDDIEVNAGIAESVETDGWLYFCIFVDLLQDGFGNFNGHAFDFFEVAVISHANGNTDDDVTVRHAEVSDVRGSDFLIWYDYHIGISAVCRHLDRVVRRMLRNAKLAQVEADSS